MDQITERIIKNKLRDLAGLKISGQIPLSEELLNTVIQEFLQEQGQPSSPPTTTAEPEPAAVAGPSPADLQALLQYLNLRVEAKTGAVVLHLDYNVR